MSLVIDVPPEVEAAIQHEAAYRGTTPDALVGDLLKTRFLPRLKRPEGWPPAEQGRRFDEWLLQHPDPGPPLPDGALSRDNLYE